MGEPSLARTAGAGARTLSVSKLSGISLYEPGALTIVVSAGTPLAEVDAALDAEGQRLSLSRWTIARCWAARVSRHWRRGGLQYRRSTSDHDRSLPRQHVGCPVRRRYGGRDPKQR